MYRAGVPAFRVPGTGMTLANSDILAAALACVQRGWSVIPIKSGTKVAAVRWGKYQKRRPDRSELESWFGNGSGFELALVLGDISGGLVCRDFDDKADYDAWAAGFPDLARTLPTVATSRGRHVYFRAKTLTSQKFDDGEYRANGNYVLLPPSLHPSGVRYTWVVRPPEGDFPLVDPVKSGLLPPAPAEGPTPPEKTDSTPAKASLPRLTQRTQRFLKIGAVEGHRNRELFCAACDMTAKDVEHGQAERLLLEACANCTPPYPVEEALPTIASAFSRPRKPARSKEDPMGQYVIPRCIAQRRDITDTAKLIWGAIDYRQRDRADCFPGYSTLGEDVGVNRDTVSQGIQGLEQTGLLAVRRINGKSNHYTTHLPEIPSGGTATSTGPPPAGNPDPNNHESVVCGL